jgi:hypothetical protein
MLIRQLIAVCLAGLAAAVTNSDSSSGLSCNKANVALVEFRSQTQSGLCETWLNRYKSLKIIFLPWLIIFTARDGRQPFEG